MQIVSIVLHVILSKGQDRTELDGLPLRVEIKALARHDVQVTIPVISPTAQASALSL